MLVGDAAHFVNPMTGGGIAAAMKSVAPCWLAWLQPCEVSYNEAAQRNAVVVVVVGLHVVCSRRIE